MALYGKALLVLKVASAEEKLLVISKLQLLLREVGGQARRNNLVIDSSGTRCVVPGSGKGFLCKGR
jgi:hypothetical protein